MQAYLPQLQSNHDDAFLVSEFVTVYTSIPNMSLLFYLRFHEYNECVGTQILFARTVPTATGTKAADSGGLEQILTEVKKEMFDEVRSKVAGLLTEAADNGALEKILQDVKTNDVQDPKWELRQKAAKLLTEAADTGLLDKILSDKERPKKAAPPEELRQKAAKLLSEERSKKAASQESLREKAAKLLSEAADTGLLEKVLGEQDLR
ncbi:unnamed protein product [Symbiodinium sp. KB8]|nr:unnamed protein product [Symbiodinium sp. KB8]